MGEPLAAMALVMEQADNISPIELIWADSGYSGPKFQLAIAQLISVQVEI
ncbi:MAG: hypothetical protein F6K24_08280 [Okeania sp. SIO2D1]|nr:hypothetical protein [Okeania sp. SIO2D1]